MMSYVLDPQLDRDSYVIGEFKLNQLLLINDCQYPWFVLVPKRSNKSEIYQLSKADQDLLWTESDILSVALMDLYHGDKLNIGALGNVVSQLHVHHIVRFKSDACWPKPIWGQLPMKAYLFDDVVGIQKRVNSVLGSFGFKITPLQAKND